MIPQLDPKSGLLPYVDDEKSSTYRCSIGQIERAFATSNGRRELFSAFDLWRREVQSVVAGGRLWISGSFVSSKPKPSDIDVVMILPSGISAKLNTQIRTRLDLQTLQGVRSEQPERRSRRVQPVAGLVDAFFISEDVPATMELWRFRWTRQWDKQTNEQTDQLKGMLEVKL